MNVKVECLVYHDFPVVEWIAWFTNNGRETTPLLRDILAIDGSFSGASPVVYHCNGDYRNDECYEPVETPLNAGKRSDSPLEVAAPAMTCFPITV